MTKNYITPLGWRAIIDELTDLVLVQRPKIVKEVSEAAAEGDRSENSAYIYGKRRLREIDRRTGFLQRRLAIIEVVDGRKQSRERVFFGAIVDLEDEEGRALRYQIVGVDEIDAKAGRLSWQSPVGQALLGKRVGDSVRVTWHAGERELTIEGIDYLDDPPPGDMAEARRRFTEVVVDLDDEGSGGLAEGQPASRDDESEKKKRKPAGRASARKRPRGR